MNYQDRPTIEPGKRGGNTVAALLNHRRTVEKTSAIDGKACIEMY